MKFYLVLIFTFILYSCSDRIPLTEIEKDLGISIPEKYAVISHKSDFLGFNETDEYILRFDVAGFEKLTSAIKNSVGYNVTRFDEFCKLDSVKRFSLADSFYKNGQIGYWVTSNEGYEFDLINYGAVCPPVGAHGSSDQNQKVIFRNEDAKAGYPVYSVEARVNISQKTLFYKYAHI